MPAVKLRVHMDGRLGDINRPSIFSLRFSNPPSPPAKSIASLQQQLHGKAGFSVNMGNTDCHREDVKKLGVGGLHRRLFEGYYESARAWLGERGLCASSPGIYIFKDLLTSSAECSAFGKAYCES